MKGCWGEELLKNANAEKLKNVSVDDICGGLASEKLKDGSITASFEWLGKGKPTYSAHPTGDYALPLAPRGLNKG